MERTPIIESAPEGKFKLSANKETTTLPGIERKQTDTHIEVTYQNRFALFDATENVSKPIV